MIRVILAPTRDSTRVLVSRGDNEILKAVLGSPIQSHRSAAATFLEGLALFFREPLSVVLVADVQESTCVWDFCDNLGFGTKTLHYEVEFVERRRRSPGRRLGGVANFGDLRRLFPRAPR